MKDTWLVTLEACFRYQIGADMLKAWRRWRTFPADAVRTHGRTLEWNVTQIDLWLKQRPISHVGRPPRWAILVGNPSARELQLYADGSQERA
jgi:hypothetical protein